MECVASLVIKPFTKVAPRTPLFVLTISESETVKSSF